MVFLKDLSVDELIKMCRAHDDDAFSELLSRYTPMINREVASFFGGSLLYNELFSEASAALHTAAMRYDFSKSEVTFGLYARICVHNRLVDLARSAERLPRCEEYGDEDEPSTDTPESELIMRESVERLMDSARAALSDYEYRVLVLYMQGYKTAEISERLKKSPKSVDNAKSRIFTRLRKVLGAAEEFK